MPRQERRKRYMHGLIAEGVCILFLWLKGYRILAWRYKTKQGEIDLVARRGHLIIFAEVKQRKDIPEALEAVTPTAQKRISNAARQYLASHKIAASTNLRFDVMAVKLPFHIKHVENAWGF